jgi:hypothetical protein
MVSQNLEQSSLLMPVKPMVRQARGDPRTPAVINYMRNDYKELSKKMCGITED